MARRAHVAGSGVVAGGARSDARAALQVRRASRGAGEAVGGTAGRTLGARAW